MPEDPMMTDMHRLDTGTQNVRMDDELHETLYGKQDGTFALLTTAVGTIPPPYIADLSYLGSTNDVVTRLVIERMGPGRPRAQQELADLLGVGQQSVSRYINGKGWPRLTPDAWRTLVRLWFTRPGNDASHEAPE